MCKYRETTSHITCYQHLAVQLEAESSYACQLYLCIFYSSSLFILSLASKATIFTVYPPLQNLIPMTPSPHIKPPYSSYHAFPRSLCRPKFFFDNLQFTRSIWPLGRSLVFEGSVKANLATLVVLLHLQHPR